MIHSFDTEIAKEFGIEGAIILRYIRFWIAKNKANNINYREGRFWMHNSRSELCAQFPYMAPRAIRSATETLVSSGVLLAQAMGKLDRTLWYAENPDFQLDEIDVALDEIDDTLDKIDKPLVNDDACLYPNPITSVNTTKVNTTLKEKKKRKERVKNSVNPQSWIQAILYSHPRRNRLQETRDAIDAAITTYGASNLIAPYEAHLFILSRTKRYSEIRGTNLEFAYGSLNFYRDEHYLESDEYWTKQITPLTKNTNRTLPTKEDYQSWTNIP